MTVIHYEYVVCIYNLFHIMGDQNHCNVFSFFSAPSRFKYFFSSISDQASQLAHPVQYTLGRIALTPAIATLCFCPRTIYSVNGDGIQSSQPLSGYLPLSARSPLSARPGSRTKSHVFFNDRSYDLIIRILEYHSGARRTSHRCSSSFVSIPSTHMVPSDGTSRHSYMLCKCRLPRAIMPQDRNKLSRLDIQRYLINSA